MYRHQIKVLCLAIGIWGSGTAAVADCVLINNLDRALAIQTRLAANPDTALFASDIRQIRILLADVAQPAAVRAVKGNQYKGDGAIISQFLGHSAALLQKASLDDPNSVRPHFTVRIRQNLLDMRGLLAAWRCSPDQIAIGAATTQDAGQNPPPAPDTSGDEDMTIVREMLGKIAKEVLQLRTLILLVAASAIAFVVTPIIRQQRLMRKRRTKRHNCSYPTSYHWSEGRFEGMLVDINCYGAKLKHDIASPLHKGADIEISICDSPVAGTVVWENAHYAGVVFEKRIPLAFIGPICAAAPPPQTQNGAPRDAALQNVT